MKTEYGIPKEVGRSGSGEPSGCQSSGPQPPSASSQSGIPNAIWVAAAVAYDMGSGAHRVIMAVSTQSADTALGLACVAVKAQHPERVVSATHVLEAISFASGIEGEAGDPKGLHPKGESPARSEAEGDAQ